MVWRIELSVAVERWLLEDLDDRGREQMVPCIDALEEHGPALGEPLVKRIRASKHHNMKELRSVGGNLRVLFAFDPERKAILLLGGDKTNDWTGWYRRNVPKAEKLYDKHLKRIAI